MSRKRKRPPKRGAINFDLEEDADSIFAESIQELDQMTPEQVARLKGEQYSPKLGDQKSSAPKKMRTGPVVVDLHGLTLAEAKQKVESAIQSALNEVFQAEFKIITGKGLHSEDRVGILAEEIHRFVCKRWKDKIESIEMAPSDVQVRGIPIRGHFHVTLNR